MNLTTAFVFVGLVSLTVTVNSKPSGKARALGKVAEQVLAEDFLKTDAFKKTVLRVIDTRKQKDIDCQAKFGPFYYFSYTGACESCSVHCSPPTEGMKKECLEYCRDFMTNQVLKDEQIILKSNNKKLEDDLETTNQELNEAKTDFAGKFFGLLTGFLVLILLLIVFLVLFLRHVKQTYAKRPPRNANPSGDKTEETEMSSNTQCSQDSDFEDSDV
ncbi:uncharacterized protein LOC143456842 [Clavelina lepadiformis]|uniref:uncharacterized protein LOC143456842 n=1 Tax=Clavelina lepadiformis TaxID=159417 RepID=UPI004042F7BF